MKKLTRREISRYQKLGNFDEHLITFNSQVYGNAHIHEDTYLAYSDSMSKTLWLTLFELRGGKGTHDDRLRCVKTAVAEFKPTTMLTASPEKLESRIDGYSCVDVFFDKDYQIELVGFDEDLRGSGYAELRYRVKNAVKRGYKLRVGRDYTFAHARILSVHISKRKYNLWDRQAFLRLGDYIRNCPGVRLFNIFLGDVLIGFDMVDFLGDVMATPLGFCLDYPSLADFLMHEEIVYAKHQGYAWLDIGWACNPGLESFKKKWKADPRFNIYVQEYSREGDESG